MQVLEMFSLSNNILDTWNKGDVGEVKLDIALKFPLKVASQLIKDCIFVVDPVPALH